VRLALAWSLWLPRRAVVVACRAIALVGCCLLARERRALSARLAAGLGREPDFALVRRTFETAGEILADTLALLRVDERASATLALDPDSRRVFQDALDEGRGVVLIAAHLGPWERMAALLVEERFPLATVARESYDPRFTAIYERIRAPRGVRSIYIGKPRTAFTVARELAAGRVVGFLVDVPARVPSITAPLFGTPTRIPIGPARIALARRAAVLVGTCAPPTDDCLKPGGLSVARVRITRIPIEDLHVQKRDAQILVHRITDELGRRIAAWPYGWLGGFAAP